MKSLIHAVDDIESCDIFKEMIDRCEKELVIGEST
jgi:hypothetical protein